MKVLNETFMKLYLAKLFKLREERLVIVFSRKTFKYFIQHMISENLARKLIQLISNFD